jgi:hypothetical protein
VSRSAAADNHEVTVFFDVAYALVVFAAVAIVGAVPGVALGVAFPRADRRLLLPAVGVALAFWIWAGWLGDLYGISRLGLLVFAAIGGAGFVYGWSVGLRIGERARARCSRTRVTQR